LSYLNWQSYNERSGEASKNLKTSIEKILGTENPSSTPTAQIDAVLQDFGKKYGENPCQLTSLYEWQTVLPMLKDKQTHCNDQFGTALEVIKALQTLSAFLKDQTKAASLVATTLESTKATTNYSLAAASWKEVTNSKELSESSQFKATSSKIKTSAASISDAFTALSKAIKNEDKANLNTATTNLTTAYESLADVSLIAKTEQSKLTTRFIELYNKL
jgi:hypothetical protein